MPSSNLELASGSIQTAAAQLLKRKNVIVVAPSFGLDWAGSAALATWTYVIGLPKIMVSLLQYPEYDRGDFVFQARNYISWRVVSLFPGQDTPDVNFFTEANTIPLTTPQLLPVGQPISFELDVGGVQAVAVEFDVTSGVPAINQGVDRVVVTISASS